MTKYQATLKEFTDALNRFEEVLREEKTEFIRDSAIKRFEIVFDLSWKVIKAWMEDRGVTCTSPLGCFKEAYRQGLINYEEIWVEMVKTRNKTAHTYSQKLAEEVYAKLPEALTTFQKLAAAIAKEET